MFTVKVRVCGQPTDFLNFSRTLFTKLWNVELKFYFTYSNLKYRKKKFHDDVSTFCIVNAELQFALLFIYPLQSFENTWRAIYRTWSACVSSHFLLCIFSIRRLVVFSSPSRARWFIDASGQNKAEFGLQNADEFFCRARPPVRGPIFYSLLYPRTLMFPWKRSTTPETDEHVVSPC